MRKSILLAAIIIIILVIAGALALGRKSNNNTYNPPSNSQSSQNQAASGQAAMTGAINIINMMFTPSQITVAKGGTVTWTNNDTTTHTVIDDLSNIGGPSSGDIAPGSTYSFKFEKTGSFQYHCQIHPSMRGTIVVK